MLNLSNLYKDVAHTTLKDADGNDVLHVSYAPSKMSPATIRRMNQLDTKTELEQMDGLVDILHDLLLSWDLVEEKERPEDPDVIVPLTKASVSRQPLMLLNLIAGAVFADMQVGKTNGMKSKQD